MLRLKYINNVYIKLTKNYVDEYIYDRENMNPTQVLNKYPEWIMRRVIWENIIDKK